MTEKLDVYGDVIIRLATETVSCSPASWSDGLLSIQSDGLRLTYQLRNAKLPEKATISENLRDLIDELYVRMRSAGDVWNAAALAFWHEGDDLKFKVDFQYSEAMGAADHVKSPWWKFGRR